jgi:LacI family transcriptional regulator
MSGNVQTIPQMEGPVANIHDVAKRAGVSPATVSRVLSNHGRVNVQTRTRVLQAVEDLHYIPNALARGLKTRRSGMIALIIPEIINSFYTTLARGVEDVTNEHGLHVVLGNTDEKLSKERAYIDLMLAHYVDGVIVAPASSSARHLRPLATRSIPVVLIDRTVMGYETDIVRGENFESAILLTRHLLELGHRQIAFINGDAATSSARDREQGFRMALTQAGTPVAEELISRGSWFIEDGERRTTELLDKSPGFSAIFAANNFMAIGALRALRGAGIRVPEQIAIVCFDDVEAAAEIEPFLTVMAQPAYSMGTLAAKLLVERIEEKFTGPAREVVLSPRLLVRRSCGAPATLTGLPRELSVSRLATAGSVTGQSE